MDLSSILRRKVRTSVAVGTATAATLAAWGGATLIDASDDATARTGTQATEGSDAAALVDRGRARNVVLFIGDGFSRAHRDLVRLGTYGLDGELHMDQLPVAGSQHTEPDDPEDLVTDSAASATAIATGSKTFNGAVGVDAQGRVVRTVLERFERAGRSTGLVTTGQITDATPAAFGAHTESRGEQTEIARQYLELSEPEVLLGGGEDWWLPEDDEGAFPDAPEYDPSEGSRSDQGDLIERAEELGYEYVRNRNQLRRSSSDRLLGLFANQEMFEAEPESAPDAAYNPRVPLPEMTEKALETLSQDRRGFFLMVEEEATDEMAHRNNAELTLEAGRALDDSVAVATRFARENPGTLVLVTADHETGGLALEQVDAGDEGGDGQQAEDGPFPVPNSEKQLVVDWTTGGHTGVDVPITAGGPGAGLFTGTYDNTAIHDKIVEAARLTR